ncbi:mucin-5AC-like [Trichoplusia ni]|uniref:Mucin-5AC-like n=1 Tax=Trichoplusia ni TaxID=7111 RepID=A0A7E5X2B5_TRINI|nr:mucin-5AC-like [Trichoplusia ni]
MAVAPIFPVLILAIVTRCKGDHTSGYSTHGGNSASQFGALLKPPPPPPLPPIVPVPFHTGADRNQRQNTDVGYQYQTPPPPPPSSEFKFPAPFYKQYNFNFVPPPQPFSTTPSPSLFQKVSGWLFPSQQTSYSESTLFNNVGPIKKDCNPCNLVPWLPVIRYNLGGKSTYQNSLPTYGPPSPTAYANLLKGNPHPFNSPSQKQPLPQLSPGVPHANYGPPKLFYNGGSSGIISSTYGPPSATHTLDVISPNPHSSTYSQPSSSYQSPSSSYHTTSSGYQPPSSSYYTPSTSYQPPSSTYLLPSTSLEPMNFYSSPSSTYPPPISSYGTPSPSYDTPRPVTTPFQPVTPQYEPGTLNKELPPQNDVELLDNFSPNGELQLPKVSPPTSFKNSYGEPITNTHLFDISYPISATAAESYKVKTKVLPNYSTKPPTPNTTFALSNPAPFTLNRGRNIHTLQPVALPNLSVSPLPPIFNARPFRPISQQFPSNILKGINQMQQSSSNVHVEQSIPIAEFTHSVDYPATVIQSPIIEIDPPTISNQTKAFRNIPNSYVVDEIRDISSQASEDHISATKSIPDASFESTGTDVGNELYDSSVPAELKGISRVPSNHKPTFADLRGVNDKDVDKYRTESNLQNIDSPLLYLKPSAPHKSHGNFVLAISSPVPDNEYEIYDDIPTTAAPETHTQTTSWDESRNEYSEDRSPPMQDTGYKPKIVQIIVPYTTGKKQEEKDGDYVQMSEDWPSTPKDTVYQARKVPSDIDDSYESPVTESDSTSGTTTTEESIATDNYDSDRLNTASSLKDFYDVKEPPFDIIKLQHTIDDWTEQEYSKQYKTPQRTRNSEKYAKQIPDDYFTTTMPTNYVTTTSNYNYDFYDHEGSSSVQHSVTDESNNTISKPRKEYNTIERTKTKTSSGKHEEFDEVQKLHIYTAASSFRTTSTSTTTTTTPAPWGKIQTAISPLTKEKVYVVTSKPWRETKNGSSEWYEVAPFESKRTNSDGDYSASNHFPFRSPRFMNRPSFGFTSGGKIESDSSFGFSKSWYHSINELDTQEDHTTSSLPEATHQKVTTNSDEDSPTGNEE